MILKVIWCRLFHKKFWRFYDFAKMDFGLTRLEVMHCQKCKIYLYK